MAQQKTMATCQECGAKVRKENLKGHIEKVHRKNEAAAAKPAQGSQKPVRPRVKEGRKVSPWPAIALAAIMALSSVGAYAILTQKPSTPSNQNPTTGNRKAVIATNMGTFTIELYEDKAPRTAGNFINLAKSGFYNGLIFHRIVSNFVIQGGGFDQSKTPKTSQTVNWENTGLKNKQYTVAMARSGDPDTSQGANTATSQFFVNLVDNPSLDNYAYPFVVFGKVIEGMSVVDAIGLVSVDGEDWPTSPVIMNTVTII